MNALAWSVRVSLPLTTGRKSTDAATTSSWASTFVVKSSEWAAGTGFIATCQGCTPGSKPREGEFDTDALLTWSAAIVAPRLGKSAARVAWRVIAPQLPSGTMQVCANAAGA